MKKVLALILALSLVLVCFTGCMTGEEKYTINEDGSGQAYSKIVLEKATCDTFMNSMGMTLEDFGFTAEQMAQIKVQTVNGVESYVIEETGTFASYAELKAGLEQGGYSYVSASENGIRFVLKSQVSEDDLTTLQAAGIDMNNAFKADFTFVMPKDVVETTGTLGADKRTVTYNLTTDDFCKDYEVMISTAAETVKPVLKGFTSKKTYNKAITVRATDESGIMKATYKKGTGKTYTFNMTKKFTKNGKYTITATDYYGNKVTKTFTIKDTSKPTVSGVTNDKTYTSDRTITFKDNCAVKSATLNGISVESGIEVSNAGTYKLIVKDVNGLSRTVKFRIK